MEISCESTESPNRFFVTIRTDGRDVHGGADINRRRGGVNEGQIPRPARSLLLRHAVSLLSEKAKERLGHGERSIS
jgi:hypothetical protein